MGTDAYSLIEQGKVDTLLQASPRDRRAIFEEAAGISRFKAKKLETQRRLLRVEQNLVRLADIVEEVETRLKSVRAQANKARRYQEYTNRLKQLRTETGRADWRRLSADLIDQQNRLAELQVQQEQDRQRVVQAEGEAAQAEQQATALAERLRHVEAEWVQTHARAEAARERRTREWRRVQELAAEAAEKRLRCRDAQVRAEELSSRLEECQRSVDEASTAFAAIQSGLSEQEVELDRLGAKLERGRAALQSQRQQHAEQLRQSAQLASRLSALDTGYATQQDQLRGFRSREQQLVSQLDGLQQQLTEQESQEKRLAAAAAEASEAVQQARTQLVAGQQVIEQLRERQAELRDRETAAAERARLLTELESKQEGIGAGARDVLMRARRESWGPFREVLGMVADLVQVRVEMAPMIDVALGPLTQYIVVSGSQLIDDVIGQAYLPAGRVGIISLQAAPARGEPDPEGLAADPQVIGRADRFVAADDRYVDLVRGLLRSTWLVESLDAAARLRQQGFRQVRFVTRAGELWESDGTLVVGPRQAVAGLVSRRSELAQLKRTIDEVQVQLQQVVAQLDERRKTVNDLQEALVRLGQHHDDAAAAFARHTVELQGLRQRRHDQQQARAELEREITATQQRQQQLDGQRTELRKELSTLEQSAQALERQLEEQERDIEQAERRYQGFGDEVTQTRVELAKSEQMLDALTTQLTACRTERTERLHIERDLSGELSSLQARRGEAELLVLGAGSELATHAWHLETTADATQSARLAHQQLATQRQQVSQRLTELRNLVGKRSAQCHQVELAISQLSAERTNLQQRVQDDYGIDLAALAEELEVSENGDHDDVDAEIATLRRKISNIGAVNMEALGELDELEERFGGLSGQYQDLVDAKESLERIIQRINKDSRRLFQETLVQIRANFQQLFRRVFGGGSADVVLEEGVDILEAGIDIVATPPGKQSLNISLLSGGERALTAVTLLLAIFQYRPSPFCVLDEVDGPLDEANIGRFIDILNEFLKWTRFVVVTHSKKTMTAATTLYGVTMQESGVSKRVSVQFEDVSEDGQIAAAALERDAATPPRPVGPTLADVGDAEESATDEGAPDDAGAA